MTYVIAFNGPPQSGKDTLGRKLHSLLQASGVTSALYGFKTPLRAMIANIVDVDIMDDEIYETFKRTRYPHLNNDTGREAMIRITEDYLKPRYGDDIWANVLVQALHRDIPEVAVITDLGFDYERVALDRAFPDSVHVFCIDRPGTSFEGDSRHSVWRGPGDKNATFVTNSAQDMRVANTIAMSVHNFVLNKLQARSPGSFLGDRLI